MNTSHIASLESRPESVAFINSVGFLILDFFQYLFKFSVKHWLSVLYHPTLIHYSIYLPRRDERLS